MRETLQARIESKRAAMVETGMTKGLCDPETVTLSQELDELLNEQARQERAAKITKGAQSA